MSQSGNFTNLIPNKINTEPRFSKLFSMKTLMIVLIVFSLLNAFKDIVHPSLAIPYMLFGLLFGFSLIIPSSKNDGMLFYKTLLLTFSNNTTLYYSLEPLEVD